LDPKEILPVKTDPKATLAALELDCLGSKPVPMDSKAETVGSGYLELLLLVTMDLTVLTDYSGSKGPRLMVKDSKATLAAPVWDCSGSKAVTESSAVSVLDYLVQ
jgi:hypothetical protein